MMGHRRSPGMQHRGDADAGAEMLRVGGDPEHRLRRRPEQQVVDQRLVLEGDDGDLDRQREDDMEVPDRQEVGLPLGEPSDLGRFLHGTMQLPRRDWIGAAASRKQPTMGQHHAAPFSFAPPHTQKLQELW